ncbi:MAG TPA: hypothetical protein DD706_15300 [Nitrospiraceae bacterium]|nr:hypothetical protein [Nitrospiraceae bacterium]
MPGFAPAGEALLFWQKDPKPLMPHPASLNKLNANFWRADQLAALRQGPPIDGNVHSWARMAGIRKRLGGSKELWCAQTVLAKILNSVLWITWTQCGFI